MAFGVQQNNSRDKANVNTRGLQFSNKNGFDPSALSLGFWNDFISIKINPALDKSQQTETRVFDYDKAVSTALTPRIATCLLKGIRDHIMPAIETGETRSVSVKVGGDSLVTVGTGTKYTGEPCQFFALHKELDPGTKKPAMSIFYEFAKNNLIMNYDEKTGDYTVVSNVPDEFELFIKFMSGAVVALTKAHTHADRVVNRFNNEKLNSNIVAIGEKVGAKLMQTQSYSSSFSSRNNVDFSSNNSDGYEPELTTLSDLDALG